MSIELKQESITPALNTIRVYNDWVNDIETKMGVNLSEDEPVLVPEETAQVFINTVELLGEFFKDVLVEVGITEESDESEGGD